MSSPIKTLAPEDIIKIIAKKTGPRVLILGGVHGNETGGIEAIRELTATPPSFRLKKGQVTFVYANRQAIQKGVRFLQEDLNRCFLLGKAVTNSYEESLALDLKEIMHQHDFLLDLHSSTSTDSQPFIICEPNGYPYLKGMPIEKIVSGFDRIQPGGTDYYMNQIGKVGVCLECGYLGPRSLSNSKTVAIEGVLTFLSNLGMINYTPALPPNHSPQHFLIDWMYLTKPTFRLSQQFPDFYTVKKGEIIGYVTYDQDYSGHSDRGSQNAYCESSPDVDNMRDLPNQKVIQAPDDGILLFCNDILPGNPRNEAFVWGRFIQI